MLSDSLVILKKPFDIIEVLQLAVAMTEKWRLNQQTKLRESCSGKATASPTISPSHRNE